VEPLSSTAWEVVGGFLAITQLWALKRWQPKQIWVALIELLGAWSGAPEQQGAAALLGAVVLNGSGSCRVFVTHTQSWGLKRWQPKQIWVASIELLGAWFGAPEQQEAAALRRAVVLNGLGSWGG
jgi:hypothetical protein